MFVEIPPKITAQRRIKDNEGMTNLVEEIVFQEETIFSGFTNRKIESGHC
jgi:hypothetical protein